MNNKNQILIYKTKTGQYTVEVLLDDDTVWLTQKQMAELFSKSKSTINEHIQNIYIEGELDKKATIWNFWIVQKEGNRSVSRDIDFYNLDVIISVGYRVKSHRGTQFRQWATQRLSEYIIFAYITFFTYFTKIVWIFNNDS